MPKKTILKFFLVVAVVFATIILIVSIVWNEPHENVMRTEAVKVKADELYQCLSASNDSLKRKYINHVIAVSGKVKNVLVNNEGKKIILLETPADGAYINCTTEEKTIEISPGRVAEIKGICLGYMNGDVEMGLPGDVFLTRCYVLQNH